MDAETWASIDKLVAWLDAKTTLAPEVELLLRLLKVSGEAGEVADAVDGVYGHNPRKGFTHTWEDVDRELCDVILTGMVALRSRNADAAKVFSGHLTKVLGRSLDSSAAWSAS
ncbi:MazG-like family protein [Sphaerisporangium flaviroseum]|uniref:MazG-like family protein n=1 Tax=Sphaerisporangium flaviroseum TaxID=509199 RepID=A0ABP7JGL6_9ACTN